MPDLKTSIEVTPVPEGMLYQPQDYTDLQAVIDNTTNGLIDALGGPNFLPASNAVTITPAISGMSVTVGGTGQYMIAQGRILDVCPSSTITLAATGGASDRVDLIAVRATRVNGSQTITRNVRSDSATPAFLTLTGTLASGTATIALPSGYTIAPTITGITPIGLDVNGKVDLVSVNTSQAVFQSSDSNDSRQFAFNVTGTPTGYAGIPTTITQQENRPAWAYVEGTNTTPPSPPSGYDAFATIYVHAFETSISSNDITYLFPKLPALSTSLVLAMLGVNGNLSVGGSTTLGPLSASNATFSSLHVTGASLLDGQVTGAANISAAAGLTAQGAGTSAAFLELLNTNPGGRGGYKWQAEDTAGGYTNILHLVDVQSGQYRLGIDMSNGVISFGATNGRTTPGAIALPGGVTLQYGTVSGIPMDGSSAISFSFSPNFTTTLLSFGGSINGGSSWNGHQLGYQVINPGTSGGSIVIYGGPSSTVSFFYFALGY